MYLRRLWLRDFRNYESLELEVGPGIAVFHGPNGAGKTNLLEAVHLASTSESPRVREVGELVRFGQQHGFVRGWYQGNQTEVKLELGVSAAGQRRIRVNDTVRRRGDLIGLAPVVYFSAEDIAVIKGEPSGRRRMLDAELCSLRRSYLSDLTRYRRAIEQRNRLLKEMHSGREGLATLDPWDRATARYGARVMAERGEFLDKLSVATVEAYGRLTGGERAISLEYRPSFVMRWEQDCGGAEKGREAFVEELAHALEAALRQQRGTDLAARVTTLGPHRDDFEVMLRGRPVRAYGSQGQQRAAALAARLGVAAMAEAATGERPVLLLDDVLSELDARCRVGVFAACHAAEQALITSCDREDVPTEQRTEATVFEVRDGRLV